MEAVIIVIQLIGGITLIPWFGAAGLSFMAFDSPRSIRKISTWLYVLTIFCYPFVLGGCFWKAWDFYDEGKVLQPSFVSILPIILFYIAYLFVTRYTNFYNQLNRRK